jgi:hypothetical protein
VPGLILAEIDGAQPEAAGERCAQLLLVQDCLLRGDLRARVFEACGIAVERGLADRLDLELLSVALVGDRRELCRGLERAQLRDVVIGPEREQERAGLDLIT